MKTPPEKQNVGLLSSSYSQEIVSALVLRTPLYQGYSSEESGITEKSSQDKGSDVET
jgi:hypothetical protein